MESDRVALNVPSYLGIIVSEVVVIVLTLPSGALLLVPKIRLEYERPNYCGADGAQ